MIRFTAVVSVMVVFAALGCGPDERREFIPEDRMDESSLTNLSAQGSTPVTAGAWDLLCELEAQAKYTESWLPMWGSGGYNLSVDVDVDERRLTTGNTIFRIPAVQVEPGATTLTIKVTDHAGFRDKKLGKLELLVGASWPVEAEAKKSSIRCYGKPAGEPKPEPVADTKASP